MLHSFFIHAVAAVKRQKSALAIVALLFSLLLVLSAPVQGSPSGSGDPTYINRELYISPTGRSTASGSAADPLTLNAVINLVRPGDLVWFMEGRYQGNFVFTRDGSPTMPIILRAHPGARVELVGRIQLSGDYTWLWGMDISDPNQVASGSAGVDVNASGVRVINNVVHDVCGKNGVGAWDTGSGQIYYGNVLYRNGCNPPSGGHPHNLYTQNTPSTHGTKVFVNNAFLETGCSSSCFSWHAYTEGNLTNGYDVEGNIFAYGRVIHGGLEPSSDVSFNGNYFYSTNVQFGYARPVQYEFTNNYVGRGQFTTKFHWTEDSRRPAANRISGNTFVQVPVYFRVARYTTLDGRQVVETSQSRISAADVWDNNRFLGAWNSGSFAAAGTSTSPTSLTQWRSLASNAGNPFDRASATEAMPTQPRVVVLPNEYDPSLTMIAVYNWTNASSVTVDLPGEVSVYNARTPFGALVAKGTNTVSLPLSGEFQVFTARRKLEVAPTPVPGASQVPAASGAIFSDTFDSGTLDTWTERVTDGDDLKVTAAARLGGLYGLQTRIDDNNILYIEDNEPIAETSYRVRFAFDPNSLPMASGDNFGLFESYSSAAVLSMQILFGRTSTGYQVLFRLRDDGNVWRSSPWLPISDAPHTIEMDFAAGASGSNNGALRAWIDGTQQANLTGLNSDTRNVERVRLGAVTSIDSGTRGTVYFDNYESFRQYSGEPAGPVPAPGAAPTAGAPTATFTPTAALTPVPTTTAVPPASGAIFEDGFEGGSLVRWSSSTTDSGDLAATNGGLLVGSYSLRAQVDDNNGIYVQDESPAAEKSYWTRFAFDPNSITMGSSDNQVIFEGYANNGVLHLQVLFGRASSGYQLQFRTRDDAGAWRASAWLPISDAPHTLETGLTIATAGQNNGTLQAFIDGTQQANLTGLNNDTRNIERVRLGAVTSIDSGTRGTIYFDDFASSAARVTSSSEPTAETPAQTAPAEPTAETPAQTAPALNFAVVSLDSADLFTDDFEGGSLARWTLAATSGTDLNASAGAALAGGFGMQATINDNSAIYVQDESPNAALAYQAGFVFDPNSIPMNNGDMHVIFEGYSSSGMLMLQVLFGRGADGYQLQFRLRDDANVWRSSPWLPISDAAHTLELDFRAASAAGQNNGTLQAFVDGTQQANLTGLDSDTRNIERIRLGAVTSIDSGTRGVTYFDNFISQNGQALQSASANTLMQPSASPLVAEPTAAVTPETAIVAPAETVFEAEAAPVQPGPGWVLYNAPVGASGSGYLINAQSDTALELAFTGASVDVVYVSNQAFGSFALEIDGQIVQTVRTGGGADFVFGQRARAAGLTPGAHVLRLAPQQSVVAIDRFIVDAAGEIAPVIVTEASAEPTFTPTASVPAAEAPPTLAAPLPEATPAPAGGLVGEYFNGLDFAASALTRLDPTIDFNWGEQSPDPLVSPDGFSARWIGFLTPRYSETYTLTARSDDGVRLSVNNQNLFSRWSDGLWETSGTVQLTAGQPAPIILEYYDATGAASLQLFWSSASQPAEIIPASQLSGPQAVVPAPVTDPAIVPTTEPLPTDGLPVIVPTLAAPTMIAPATATPTELPTLLPNQQVIAAAACESAADRSPGSPNSESWITSLRFCSVPVPAGAVINSAWLELTGSGNSADPLTVEIAVEQAADSAPFTPENAPSARPRTPGLPWTLNSWQNGMVYRSPELTPVLTLVLNHAGWQPGNDLSLILSGMSGQPLARSGNPPTAARLVVTFTYAPVQAPTLVVPTEVIPTLAAPTLVPTEIVPTLAAPTVVPTELVPTLAPPTTVPTEVAPAAEPPTEAPAQADAAQATEAVSAESGS